MHIPQNPLGGVYSPNTFAARHKFPNRGLSPDGLKHRWEDVFLRSGDALEVGQRLVGAFTVPLLSNVVQPRFLCSRQISINGLNGGEVDSSIM